MQWVIGPGPLPIPQATEKKPNCFTATGVTHLYVWPAKNPVYRDVQSLMWSTSRSQPIASVQSGVYSAHNYHGNTTRFRLQTVNLPSGPSGPFYPMAPAPFTLTCIGHKMAARNHNGAVWHQSVLRVWAKAHSVINRSAHYRPSIAVKRSEMYAETRNQGSQCPRRAVGTLVFIKPSELPSPCPVYCNTDTKITSLVTTSK